MIALAEEQRSELGKGAASCQSPARDAARAGLILTLIGGQTYSQNMVNLQPMTPRPVEERYQRNPCQGVVASHQCEDRSFHTGD